MLHYGQRLLCLPFTLQNPSVNKNVMKNPLPAQSKCNRFLNSTPEIPPLPLALPSLELTKPTLERAG